MKILVVGASGFVGGHLTAHLSRRGHQVEAWSRRPGPAAAGVTWRSVDLLSGELPAPSDGPWEAAFHLAAHTRPSLPWSRALVLENLDLCARVLDHLAATAPGCRTILASSAHVYAPSEAPHREGDACAPQGLYGLSKQLCEAWALSHRSSLRVQIVRAFNQLGPGMPAGLLLPDLLAHIHAGEDPIPLMGRDDVKDFLDVRDAVAAYEALLSIEAPSGSVWNLCSGRPLRVSELAHAVLDHLGMARRLHFASSDVNRMIGDASRLQAATGWRPTYGLPDMVAHTLEGSRG